MKKIFSTVLLCILVLTMSATVFAADCNYLLTVDSTELTPGDVVTLTIKLDTNPGIANYKNVVTFDSKVFEEGTIVGKDGKEFLKTTAATKSIAVFGKAATVINGDTVTTVYNPALVNSTSYNA